jgi:hypothetical protein
MNAGACNLAVVPLRAAPDDTSELISQILYGESFTVLKSQKKWSLVRLDHDNYEGWLDNKQFVSFSRERLEEFFLERRLQEPLAYVTLPNGSLMQVPQGSRIDRCTAFGHKFENSGLNNATGFESIANTAVLFLNSPYLWGGRTFMGIDCSGFTQLVYILCGHDLPRDACDQAKMGKALSFIEEAAVGDLAFFDNQDGEIIHTGIILNDNYIIHAHGRVRIDRLDHTGIFNEETRQYSHKLRVIKKIAN